MLPIPQERSALRSKAITIIVPAYGAGSELTACLGALPDPSEDLEIIVIDDASPVPIVLGDRPVRLIRHDRNRGPAAARNSGLEAARHPWVFFVDSDVVISTKAVDWIRETLELYRHRPEVIGVLGAYSEEIPSDDFWSNYKNLQVCHLYRTTSTVSPYLHTPMFCVRREILQKAGGFDASFATAEDFRLGVALGSRGYRFVIDRRLTGVHLKRYDFLSILREDARRLNDLSRLNVPPGQRTFAYRAHRPTRMLAASIPLPLLITTALAPFDGRWGWAALFLFLLFVIAVFPVTRYMGRLRGIGFACKAGGFLFLEMLWTQLLVLVRLPQSVLSRLRAALVVDP